MPQNNKTFLPLGFTAGLTAAIGLIAYFLLMRLFHLTHVVWLHMFNFIIIAAVIYWALNRGLSKKVRITYLSGLILAALVSFITAVFFALFIFIYATVISPGFISGLEGNLPFGQMGEPFSFSIALWVETLFGGSIIGFIIMQWLKSKRDFQMDSHHQS